MKVVENFQFSGTTKEIYFVCVTFLTFLFCGINRAYLAFLFHQLDNPKSSIILHDEEKSLLAAYGSLLSPFGCLIGGICMDLIGRKYTLQLIYIPFIFSWALITNAESVNMLYIAFLGQGIGVGMAFCVIAYITEICTPKYRGSLFVVLMINYNSGVLLSNYLMYLLSWDKVAVILTGASVFVLTLTCFLPESPIWLYLNGRIDKSIKTLCFIRSKQAYDLESEIQDLKKFCSLKENTTLTNILKNSIKAWRQLLILSSLHIIALSSGYVTIAVFGIMILNSLKLPYESSQILLIYSIIGVLTCFLTSYFVHKFNRKTLLSVSSVGMSICLFLIATYQQLDENIHQTYIWVVPALFYLFSFIGNLSVVPIAFIMGGELLPNESRGVLSGIYGSIGFLYVSLLQKLFPNFLAAVGVVTSLYTFSVSCFILTLYSIFILPETKGKTLNQIQEEYFLKNKIEDFS